mmetsp:Transcript_41088/g.64174  ORF Transcript_41088/g.64174 Transcript_41088/m.64174 type:complete len:131 (+) Transcript_41088:445-837(+)
MGGHDIGIAVPKLTATVDKNERTFGRHREQHTLLTAQLSEFLAVRNLKAEVLFLQLLLGTLPDPALRLYGNPAIFQLKWLHGVGIPLICENGPATAWLAFMGGAVEGFELSVRPLQSMEGIHSPNFCRNL